MIPPREKPVSVSATVVDSFCIDFLIFVCVCGGGGGGGACVRACVRSRARVFALCVPSVCPLCVRACVRVSVFICVCVLLVWSWSSDAPDSLQYGCRNYCRLLSIKCF